MSNPLRKYRDDNHLTQPALARLLGVKVMTVSRWERGENTPRQRHWPKIEEITGIAPQELLGLEEKPGAAA